MDQYVKVVFPVQRQVRVDGQPAGKTNKVFQVETGRHVFDLGLRKDYKPTEQVCDINGTLPGTPMIIVFEQV